MPSSTRPGGCAQRSVLASSPSPSAVIPGPWPRRWPACVASDWSATIARLARRGASAPRSTGSTPPPDYGWSPRYAPRSVHHERRHHVWMHLVWLHHVRILRTRRGTPWSRRPGAGRGDRRGRGWVLRQLRRGTSPRWWRAATSSGCSRLPAATTTTNGNRSPFGPLPSLPTSRREAPAPSRAMPVPRAPGRAPPASPAPSPRRPEQCRPSVRSASTPQGRTYTCQPSGQAVPRLVPRADADRRTPC